MNIVGIAGLPRSGKDTLAEWFIEAGYYGASLGDIVREEARQRHATKPDPISVANMTETANHLRQERGADVALKTALDNYEAASRRKQYAGLVVYSVRTPVEADFVLQQGGRLIWVEASDEVRYTRAVQFARDGEMKDIDMDTFIAHEALQWQPRPGIPKSAQMNVAYVKSRATDVVNNNSNIQDFRNSFDALL